MKKKVLKQGVAWLLALAMVLGESSYAFAEEPESAVVTDVSGDIGENTPDEEDVSGGDEGQEPAGDVSDGNNAPEEDVSGNDAVPTEDIPEMFPGLPDGYALTADEFSDKAVLGEYAEEWSDANDDIDYVSGEIIVEADTEEEAKAYAEAFNGTLTDYFYGIAVIELNADDSLPEASVYDAVYASSLADCELPAAWPNYIRYADDLDVDVMENTVSAVSSEELISDQLVNEVLAEDTEAGVSTDANKDPYLSTSSAYLQWHHSILNSQLAWQAGYRGKGVKVAVLDTGIKSGHEDVSAVHTYDVGYGTEDGQGHGTHVCGIIGAKLNNGKGGAGVAPECSIYSIKVLEDDGGGSSSVIMKGVNQAVAAGADIVNMSLGGPTYSLPEEKVYKDAYEAGVAVFCAAGNESSSSAHYPAAYKATISVAALEPSMGKAYFSNYDSGVRYSAPGVDIYSTYYSSTNAYTKMSGTSQATPVTAGAAAVIWPIVNGSGKYEGKAKVDNLLKKMDASCSKVSGKGLGKGCIDLAKALGLTNNEAAPLKPVFGTKAGTYTTSSLSVTISSPDPGCTIYYSTDGKTITYKNGVLSANAKKYTGAFPVSGQASVTVYAIAVKNSNKLASQAVSARYTLKPPVTGVTVSSTTGVNYLAQGTSLTLKATCAPTYAANKTVKWSINATKETGVSISSSGKVSATKTATPGNYTVTATSKDGPAANFTVTVKAAPTNPVTSITGKTKTVNVYIGQSVTVTDTIVTKKDKSTGTYAALNWMSQDKTVATVSKTAGVKITGVKLGKTTITGVAADGTGKTFTITVNVKQQVTSITPANSVTSYTLRQNKSIKLDMVVAPATAADKKLKWTVSPEGKGVTVNNGVVKATKDAATGSYTIKATAADGMGAYRTCTVSVIADMTSANTISVNKKTVDIFRIAGGTGGATSSTVTVTCPGGYWDVSNNAPGIVSVSRSGSNLTVKATGQATGTATITVSTTDGTNKKASFKVNVKNPISDLMIAPPSGKSLFVAKGTTMQLVPTFITANGKVNADAKKLSWSSSNPSAIKVDNQGRVTGMTNGRYTVTITARTTDGSGVSASYVLYSSDKTKSLSIGNNKPATVSVGYYIDRRLYVSSNSGSGSVSTIWDVKCNKEGVTAEIVWKKSGSSSYPYLRLVANKKGTYTVTVSCMDGSSAKKSITVKVQ